LADAVIGGAIASSAYGYYGGPYYGGYYPGYSYYPPYVGYGPYHDCGPWQAIQEPGIARFYRPTDTVGGPGAIEKRGPEAVAHRA
jgi:hypothetical protein